ncbi:MAG TPA: SDR family oxidoreductase [Candidatus Paceibacterota bacterium]
MNTLDTFNLNGRIALITGAAGLLGEKHAEAILDGGGRVVLTDINTTLLDEKARQLVKKYGKNKVWQYTCDITDENAVKSIIEKINMEAGPIDILINNAANNPKVEELQKNFSRLENFKREMWDKDIAVGITGAFLLSKYIAPEMAKRGKGVILNIASELGVIAPDQRLYRNQQAAENNQPVKPVTYSVVKHGIIGLTKYLATYWLGEKVRCNAVAFGGVENNTPKDFLDRIGKLSVMGRMAKPDEYKAAVLFLCSDASSYMTGSVITIDGGRTVW